MTKDKALDLALDALGEIEWSNNSQWQSDRAKVAITAIKQARALDKMAENARELGLDYDPAGGTQVSKVWWDGEKLMAKPIPPEDIYQPAHDPVAYGVFEGGNLHDMFFSKEEAEHMALLKGSHAEVRPLCTPPADGYDKVLQAIKEARPAVVALKDKPVSWWLDRFEEFVKQLKEKHT